MQLGIDRFLESESLRAPLKNRRVALLAHPASMTGDFVHTVDALMQLRDLKLAAAFGPQHGMRGEKQDNMVESEDFVDPVYKIPVLLVDLQDVGTRIYTFLTTLLYVLEAGAQTGKGIWVLDRPNPAGRPIEGSLLKPGWESFVGAGELPMRHGLTLGEAALWFKKNHNLDVELKVISMHGYRLNEGPGYGWPLLEIPWVNPSPNATTLSMARCFPGTVMLEGTNFSEGRGTTRPLELVGAPDIDVGSVLKKMEEIAPEWMRGGKIRPCFFQPTFHKYAGEICAGFQIHVDDKTYQHEVFKPYRLIALFLKAVRRLYPDYLIWRDFHYEYEKDRLAIDLINGGPALREWVDDTSAVAADFESFLAPDEKAWAESRQEFLLY